MVVGCGCGGCWLGGIGRGSGSVMLNASVDLGGRSMTAGGVPWTTAAEEAGEEALSSDFSAIAWCLGRGGRGGGC